MVNWLVCLDGSANSDAALYSALYMMNRDSDHLFLMTVYERVLQHFPVTYTPPALSEQMHAEARRAAMKVLRRCIRVCEAYHVNHTGLLAASNHVGEMICDQLKEKHVDFCVIGRRGAGGIQRFFMGSNSKYVMEHAECTVIVVRGDWGPAEEHDSKQSVLDAEEAERQRRMKHETHSTAQHDAMARSSFVDHVRDAIAKHGVLGHDDNDAEGTVGLEVEKHFGEQAKTE